MMRQRKQILMVMAPLAALALLYCIFYGPSQRVYTPSETIVSPALSADILQIWKESGAKGRLAILFTRRLNAEEPNAAGLAGNYLQTALQQGIVRSAIHVLPDSAWSEVDRNLSNNPTVRRTPSGFVLLFDEGRVLVTALSRFKPVAEQALVVIEPSIWSADELRFLGKMVAERDVLTDILAVIKGTADDFELFDRSLTLQRSGE